MAVNEEHRQLAIANELAEVARTLAHSTRDVPRPSDSYALLGELAAAQRSLAQVYGQLATWHANTHEGRHHAGYTAEPAEIDLGAGTAAAAARLEDARGFAAMAEEALDAAYSHNGIVRWFDSTDPTAE